MTRPIRYLPLIVVFLAALSCGRKESPALPAADNVHNLLVQEDVLPVDDQAGAPMAASEDSLRLASPAPEEGLLQYDEGRDSLASRFVGIEEDVAVRTPDNMDDPLAGLFDAPADTTAAAMQNVTNGVNEERHESAADTTSMPSTDASATREEQNAGLDPVSIKSVDTTTIDPLPLSDSAAIDRQTDSASMKDDIFEDIFALADTAVYVKLPVHKDINQQFNEGSVIDSTSDVLPEEAVPSATRHHVVTKNTLRTVLMFLLGLTAVVFVVMAVKLIMPDKKAIVDKASLLKEKISAFGITKKGATKGAEKMNAIGDTDESNSDNETSI